MADLHPHHESTLPFHPKPGVQQDASQAQGGDGGSHEAVTPSQPLESDEGAGGLQEKVNKPVSLESEKDGGSFKDKVDKPESLAAANDDGSSQPKPKKVDPFDLANKPADWSPTESELDAIMSGQTGDKRGPHQDYIVRQRYDNKLPPPPGSVKLLPLQGDREALDQYTLPTYGGRLARQQPVNIDADALGGMDINLVGMPGIFEGDESSIQAPMIPPPIHPKDKALLRPLKSLGKPKTDNTDFSFLRRTQYAGDDRIRTGADPARISVRPNPKKKRPEATKEDPEHILRSVIKGFDIANPETAYKGPDTATETRGHAPTAAELEAWEKPKHPTNPNAVPVDFYPILPGLEAMPDDGAFTIVNFKGKPTHVTDHADPRMEAALLHPDVENLPELSEDTKQKLAAHKVDPEKNPHPLLPYNYSFYMPDDEDTAKNFQRKFDPTNPDRDDPALYTAKRDADDVDNNMFRYPHVRDYETAQVVDSRGDPYKEVVLALHDGDAAKGIQKGAYYYPISQKLQLKPKRKVNIPQMGVASQVEDNENAVDVVHVAVRDPNPDEAEARAGHRQELEAEEGPEEAS